MGTYEWLLFFHVTTGAFLLLGGGVVAGALNIAALRRDRPSEIVQWIVGKEFPDGADTPGWVDVGFLVSEPGAVLLIVLGVLAWVWKRRGGSGSLALVVPLLATVYLVALGVAWFAMSGKP